jgi:predicted lipoprotein with Yx(FWY)xxD motif
MTKPTKLLKLSCALILGFAAAGCGSDSKSSSSTAAAATTPTTTAATTAPTTAATTASTEMTATSEATEMTEATDETEASGGSESSEATETTESSVQLVDSDLGKILADADGKVLYMFTKDTGTTSACTGDCATAWPALHGPSEPGEGLDDDDFATITGSDGKPQTTFYGHPLYYFSGDSAAGDVNGQGVGGVWFAVDAEGNAAGADSAATTEAGYGG